MHVIIQRILKLDKQTQVFSLLHAASKIERKLDQALSCTKGISFTEFYLLRQLSEMHQSSATRVDLAKAVRLTPSAVTRALKPLEKMGIVVTEKSDRDARRSLATLTPSGRELLQDANGIFKDAVGTIGLSDYRTIGLSDYRIIGSHKRKKAHDAPFFFPILCGLGHKQVLCGIATAFQNST